MPRLIQTDRNDFVAMFADEHPTIHVNHYLTIAEKREVLKQVGYASFIVLGHYFFKASMRNGDFSDDTVAKELGMPSKTVRTARKKLKETGWFYQIKYTNRKGFPPIQVIALGEASVFKFQSKSPADLHEMLSQLFKKAEING